MSQAARVSSTEAIKDFRAAFCRFGEEARNALGGVEMELNRALDWVLHDRPRYWEAEIRRRQEGVAQARTELHRRRLSGGADREPNDTVQKEALRAAQRRLREAEDKLAVVRRWGPLLQRAADEYAVRARPLADMLAGDLGRALALLDRMSAALDAYLELVPPSLPEPSFSSALPEGGARVEPSAVPEPAAAPEPSALPEAGTVPSTAPNLRDGAE